jgi:hypothetical protein
MAQSQRSVERSIIMSNPMSEKEPKALESKVGMTYRRKRK